MGQFTRSFGDFSETLHLVARAKAPEQAGIFAGVNPATYTASDPIRLWIIQVVIIIGFTQLLSLVLARIRQPRVISEVIGGIILGPSIMGRIPNFTNTIFPAIGMPLLNLTANIGLVLFLFLVGLEIDVGVVRKNMRSSAAISIAGLIIPLGLGAALGVPLYHQFVDASINYGYFLLFTAVAIGITAFPVLCRILTETKLLDTTVGVVALSAGVGNDVIGWILLALTVALVNSGNGITALWVLLTGVGYVLFMLFLVKPGFKWLSRRTGSLETGQPSAFIMTIALLLVFFSAFFTDIIGIHAIFGGFLAGLVIPHENGFAISLTEKLEDLVSLLFLPLYFTYSGLNTNLGLLNNGITWGYTILICVIAFFSKFLGCFTAAKLTGYNLRESGAIGALMSCKGLVELIVLNVGLSAGILDTRTFSMFVLHALVLTFMTTPLTLFFYPMKYRTHVSQVKDTKTLSGSEAAGNYPATEGGDDRTVTRFSLVLDKIEQLPAAMTLAQLLQPSSTEEAAHTVSPHYSHESVDEKGTVNNIPTLPQANSNGRAPITIDVLRLVELTARTSAVLKSQESDSLIQRDPVVSVFCTFGHLNRLSVSAELSVTAHSEFSTSVARHVQEVGSQMVIIPWARSSNPSSTDDATANGASSNPFDGVFSKSSTAPAVVDDQTSSVVYSEFIRRVFADSPVDVALFVERGALATESHKLHYFLPFFGGPDDRLALSFVVQLCARDGASATIVRMAKTDSDAESVATSIEAAKKAAIQSNANTFADTVYGYQSTQTRLESDTADNLVWANFTSHTTTHSPQLTLALSRVTFSHHSSPKPLHSLLELLAAHPSCIAVLGRSRRLAVESHQAELRSIVAARGGSIGSEVPKTLGEVGAALVASGSSASLLVLQAH